MTEESGPADEASTPTEPPDSAELPTTLEPPTPTDLPPPLEPAPPPVPAVESTRRLLGASFDLLTQASDDMRLASFYIGTITLITLGPLALAAWATEVVSIHRTAREMESILVHGAAAWYGLLASPRRWRD